MFIVNTNTEITFDAYKNGRNIHMLWECLTPYDIFKQLTVTQGSAETRENHANTRDGIHSQQ
jgi:hypothetical protein